MEGAEIVRHDGRTEYIYGAFSTVQRFLVIFLSNEYQS
jgi:hypothetical protein